MKFFTHNYRIDSHLDYKFQYKPTSDHSHKPQV